MWYNENTSYQCLLSGSFEAMKKEVVSDDAEVWLAVLYRENEKYSDHLTHFVIGSKCSFSTFYQGGMRKYKYKFSIKSVYWARNAHVFFGGKKLWKLVRPVPVQTPKRRQNQAPVWFFMPCTGRTDSLRGGMKG